MTKAFVAGATGYTGREVVRQLVEQGIETIAHIRPNSPKRREWEEKFAQMGATVDVTPWGSAAMADSMSKHKPDLVFALLGTTKARGKQAEKKSAPPETYETVDFGLTVLLLDALVQVSLQPRFVYLSSLGVTSGTRNAYLQARWKVESTLSKGNIPYTIARPGFITGPDRDEFRPAERIGAAIGDRLLKTVRIFGAKKTYQRFRSNTNTTLARALIRLAQDPKAANQIVESEHLHG